MAAVAVLSAFSTVASSVCANCSQMPRSCSYGVAPLYGTMLACWARRPTMLTERHKAIRGGGAIPGQIGAIKEGEDAWNATMVFWPISPGSHHGEPVARRGLAAVAAQAVRGASLSGSACRAGGLQRDPARGRVAPHGRHGRRAQDLPGADPPGTGGDGSEPAVYCHAASPGLSLCGASGGVHGARPSLPGGATVRATGPAPPRRGGRAP